MFLNSVETHSVVFRQLSMLTFYEKSDIKHSLYLSMRLSESEACLNCFYNNNNNNNNIAVIKLFSFFLFEAKGPLAVKQRKWWAGDRQTCPPTKAFQGQGSLSTGQEAGA